MKLSIVGIVCFALISAASAQYFYSSGLIEARAPFVRQHADALVATDEAYFRYYEHVRQTAEDLFAPFKDAKDAYYAAIENLDYDVIQSSSPQFSSLNSTIASGFDMIVGHPSGMTSGMDPIQQVMQYIQGTGMDWASPAQSLAMTFSNIMSIVVSTLSQPNPYTMQPRSDVCIGKVFGRVQAMYGVVASRSLTDADEAINSVDEAKTVLSIYVDAVIEQLGFVTADIQACAGDAACLDGLYQNYYFLSSSFDIPSQLGMSLSQISQQYPGMQGNSDVSMWLYNIAQMC